MLPQPRSLAAAVRFVGKCVLCLSAAVTLGLGACSSAHDRATRGDLQFDAAKNFTALRLNEVVIVPFSAVGKAQSALSEEQLRAFTDDLVTTFDRETSLSVLNHVAAARIADALSKSPEPAEDGIRGRAVRLASAVGAQGVIVGQIGRYEDLQGSRFGGEHLAAVGFRLLLLDSKSGRTLWSASYEHVDEPLSNNLFRVGELFDRGLGFRPAPELMQVGFRQAAQALQGLRSSAPPDAQQPSPGNSSANSK